MEKVMYYLEKLGRLIVRFKSELIVIAAVIFLIFAVKALSKKDGTFVIYGAIAFGLAVFYLVTKGLINI